MVIKYIPCNFPPNLWTKASHRKVKNRLFSTGDLYSEEDLFLSITAWPLLLAWPLSWGCLLHRFECSKNIGYMRKSLVIQWMILEKHLQLTLASSSAFCLSSSFFLCASNFFSRSLRSSLSCSSIWKNQSLTPYIYLHLLFYPQAAEKTKTYSCGRPSSAFTSWLDIQDAYFSKIQISQKSEITKGYNTYVYAFLKTYTDSFWKVKCPNFPTALLINYSHDKKYSRFFVYFEYFYQQYESMLSIKVHFI